MGDRLGVETRPLTLREVLVALGVLALLALAVLGFVACVQIEPAAFDSGVSVAGTTHLSELSIVGDLTVGDDIAIWGDLALAGMGYASVGSVITVATNGYITPTAVIQPLTAEDAVVTDKLAAGAEGQVLVLYNTSANTITITDTTGLNLAGNWAAGQGDTIMLVSDGTAWYEVSRSNN